MEHLSYEMIGHPSLTATVGGAFGREGYLTASGRGVNAVPAVVDRPPRVSSTIM